MTRTCFERLDLCNGGVMSDAGMKMPEKACPVVVRYMHSRREILAFRHSSAGNQFVKGSIQLGEAASAAAIRELWEESGIIAHNSMPLGSASIGFPPTQWHFFLCECSEVRDAWTHLTKDDFGHVFSFYWHPLDVAPDASWHSSFQIAWRHIVSELANRQKS